MMEAEEKRTPAAKPIALSMTFDDALRMIAVGGKPESQISKKRPTSRKKSASSKKSRKRAIL
jgi:hypothetical protein